MVEFLDRVWSFLAAVGISLSITSLLQIVVSWLVWWGIVYLVFRIFGVRVRFWDAIKLLFSLLLDIIDFVFAVPGADILWDGILAGIGLLFWGKSGWLQAIEVIPWPFDGFVPSLTLSGIWFIATRERRVRYG
ncbi:MAG TPA: hypothetical protein VJB87_03350 [Candidatus Nanoarchaeia archaeon]|nr:hypothetical protein [Candidatus Nanoarchaeia archaeon]